MNSIHGFFLLIDFELKNKQKNRLEINRICRIFLRPFAFFMPKFYSDYDRIFDVGRDGCDSACLCVIRTERERERHGDNKNLLLPPQHHANLFAILHPPYFVTFLIYFIKGKTVAKRSANHITILHSSRLQTIYFSHFCLLI